MKVFAPAILVALAAAAPAHADDIVMPPLSLSLTAPHEPTTRPSTQPVARPLPPTAAPQPLTMPKFPDSMPDQSLTRPTPHQYDPFEPLEKHIDVGELEQPMTSTTSVRVLAAEAHPHQWVPFMSVAREADDLDTFERFGLGGGMKYPLNDSSSINVELLRFDQSNSNPLFQPETRLMVLFEIDY